MQQTVLTTGASSGIGKPASQLFASQGWNVVATMRVPERTSELRTMRSAFWNNQTARAPVDTQALFAEERIFLPYLQGGREPNREAVTRDLPLKFWASGKVNPGGAKATQIQASP